MYLMLIVMQILCEVLANRKIVMILIGDLHLKALVEVGLVCVSDSNQHKICYKWIGFVTTQIRS